MPHIQQGIYNGRCYQVMDYGAYEKALMHGFSESEATRMGEDAYFDNRKAERNQDAIVPCCDICGAGEAVTEANGYLVCSEQCDLDARTKPNKK